MINAIEKNVSFGNKNHSDKKHGVDRIVIPTALGLVGAGYGASQLKEITAKQILAIPSKYADVFVPDASKLSKKEVNAFGIIRDAIKHKKLYKSLVEAKANTYFPKGQNVVSLESILEMTPDKFKAEHKNIVKTTNDLFKEYKTAKASHKAIDKKDVDARAIAFEKFNAIDYQYSESKLKLKDSLDRLSLIEKADKKGNITRSIYEKKLQETLYISLEKAVNTLQGKLPRVISMPKVALFGGLGIASGLILNRIFGFTKKS